MTVPKLNKSGRPTHFSESGNSARRVGQLTVLSRATHDIELGNSGSQVGQPAVANYNHHKINNMNKSELVKQVAVRTGRAQDSTRQTVDAALSLIEETIMANEPVVLHGFGAFYPVVQGTRPVRNPKSGTPMMMVPRNNVRFKSGLLLLRALNPDLDL